MLNFFISLLGMSAQASVVIVVVLLLRVLFQKLHIAKKYVMLLWIIPLICLIIPWKISSPVGFWRSAPSEYEYDNFVKSEYTGEDSDNQNAVGSDINSIVGNEDLGEENGGNNISTDHSSDLSGDMGAGDQENPGGNDGMHDNGVNTGTVGENNHIAFGEPIDMEQVLTIVTVLWGIVVIGLGLYSTITFGQLKKQLRTSIPMRDNVYLADDIPVPMVVGFIKPEIYIPSGIEASHMEYVIAHEQTHIRRKDLFVKMVAYIITCIHWFNPLVWLAYNLMIRDMEMACDEETILRLGQDKKKDYASALLQLATGRRNVFAVPLAFGEGSTKERILNILKFKKTKQILVIVALGIGILLGIIFLTKDSGVLSGASDGTEDSEIEVLTFDIVREAIYANNIHNLDFSRYQVDKAYPEISSADVGEYLLRDGEKSYVLNVRFDNQTNIPSTIYLYNANTNETLCPYLDKKVIPQKKESLDAFFAGTNRENSWRKMVGIAPAAVAWVETNLYGDLSGWFLDYGGEGAQLISGGANLGPAIRTDIVYYKTTETNLQAIINAMVDVMLKPLMWESHERPYTISKYRLDEHKLYQVSENAWMIDHINGYYAYEGIDFISWEEAIRYETPDADGLISFNREGGDGAFSYILLKDGDVYRLEKMSVMLQKEPGSPADDKSETVDNNEPEKNVTLTFDMLYNAVFAGNVGDIPFRNCLNGRKVSESEGDIYYFSNLEYQGEAYALRVNYTKGTETLKTVELKKLSGDSLMLYPLEKSGSFIYIRKWKPFEDRKAKFCQFVGIDESVYKAEWEYTMESYGYFYAEMGIWIKYALMSKEANWKLWYQDYDGSEIQRIPMAGDSTGPAVRHDIIYYQTEKNEDIEIVLDKMLRAMIDPLMEASDERAYRIVRYDLEELPVVQLTENMWMLKYIHGYYEYEGNEISDMETMINSGWCTVREDGMIPFFMQGSEDQFTYLIIKQDNVYRMQRLGMMMSDYQEDL